MHQKYVSKTFGTCPRVLCDKEILLPVGLSDELFKSRVKVILATQQKQLYCPRCREVYIPTKENVDLDGAFFGTAFPHNFLKTYEKTIDIAEAEKYVPKICGFKVRLTNAHQMQTLCEQYSAILNKFYESLVVSFSFTS
eukprot:TRINITY_DN32_c3_g1_i1.p7 TRINITY_DN32_c3_g1~~TRINITY_DN32_c3_g1_i1.p7  ORF type:complete len:139 (-),score=5.58 TRINITY_DN32_c3_g1_i1:1745-2161(-)